MARSGGTHRRHRAVRQPSPLHKGLTRSFMALVSVAAILMTGAGYYVAHGALGGITVSDALSPDDPRSSGDNMNILLIGLDSRKDQNGNDLPKQFVQDQLNAGSSDIGGYNTNTLILMHIPANGGKVEAFSIPRDDYVDLVNVPGGHPLGKHKIKEAYDLAKYYAEEQLSKQYSGADLEHRGRDAGRAATLLTVQKFLDVPIDHFAELNLKGFYDSALRPWAAWTCVLNHAVYDSYSGADFPAGPQRLDASQALAFVRQRHGLENGDLDRTHRQQAFISSVMRELQDSGTFTNLDKLQGPHGRGTQRCCAVDRLGRGPVPAHG